MECFHDQVVQISLCVTEVFIDSSVVKKIFFLPWDYILQFRFVYLGQFTATYRQCETFCNEVNFRSNVIFLYLGLIYFSILHLYFSSYLHHSGHSCIHLHFSFHHLMMSVIICGRINCDNMSVDERLKTY